MDDGEETPVSLSLAEALRVFTRGEGEVVRVAVLERAVVPLALVLSPRHRLQQLSPFAFPLSAVEKR